jgi:hypothetical protein
MKLRKQFTRYGLITILSFIFIWGVLSSNEASFLKKLYLRAVSLPHLGVRSGLDSIRFISAGNFWAVGAYQNYQTDRLLALQWFHNHWIKRLAPNPGQGWAHFFNVAGYNNQHIWAVGTFAFNNSGWPRLPFRALTEFWNGSRWSIIPAANPGKTNVFFDICVLGPHNAWAVGGYYLAPMSFQDVQFENTSRTLIEHWNGIQWHQFSSPNPGRIASFPQPGSYLRTTGNTLSGIAFVNPRNIWAVGHYWNGHANRTLILHWNGLRWSRIYSPNASPSSNVLYSIAVSNPHRIWAVGTYRPSPSQPYQTLTLLWNGRRWSRIPSPNMPGQNNQLYSSAAYKNQVWAVGRHGNNSGSGLVLHWMDQRWILIPNQKLGNHCLNTFNGIAIGPQKLWVVGEYMNNFLHWDLAETLGRP